MKSAESVRASRASTAAPPEARAAERFDLEIDVHLASEHNFYAGFSVNISEGGLFVATHMERAIGTRLEVTFTLPGDPAPITAVAEVRWLRCPRDMSGGTTPGLGLQFVSFPPGAGERVQYFIESMREPLFHDE